MNQEVGEFIRSKRKELKMSQETLAEMVGVTRETVSAWENAKCKEMKEESYEKLAQALHVKVCEIRSGKEMPELTEDDKQRLDQIIKDLCEVQDVTIRIEDRGLLSIEVGFYAYGLAMSAFSLAWMANFPNNGIVPFVCYPLCAAGFLFMLFGKRIVDKIRKKRTGKEKSSEAGR